MVLISDALQSRGDLEEALLERAVHRLEARHVDAGLDQRAVELAPPTPGARSVSRSPPSARAASSTSSTPASSSSARSTSRALDDQLGLLVARELGDRPAVTIRPPSMIAAASQVFSTSSSRCEERNTVRPSADERADHLAELEDAGGVEPVGRLVEDQQLGVGEQAAGDSEPLAHALRVARDLLVGALARGRRARSRRRSARTSRARARRRATRMFSHPGQVEVEVRLLDDRADARERLAAPRRDRPGRARASLPASARVSPSSIRIVVVLPAPLWPRKP